MDILKPVHLGIQEYNQIIKNIWVPPGCGTLKVKIDKRGDAQHGKCIGSS